MMTIRPQGQLSVEELQLLLGQKEALLHAANLRAVELEQHIVWLQTRLGEHEELPEGTATAGLVELNAQPVVTSPEENNNGV